MLSALLVPQIDGRISTPDLMIDGRRARLIDYMLGDLGSFNKINKKSKVYFVGPSFLVP